MLIAQITDSHIVPKGAHWQDLPSTEIHQRLGRAVAFLKEVRNQPDVVLVTGDLADEGDEESYRYFRELIAPLSLPLYIIPGNHDHREEMRRQFSDHSYLPKQGLLNYVIEEFPVRLIGLDTHVEGRDFGFIGKETVLWLDAVLQKLPEKPTLLFMHHPPTPVGAKVFDEEYICRCDPEFEALLRKKESLLGIVAGHYHHLFTSTFGGKPCFSAPSLAPTHYFEHPDDPAPIALELDDPAVSFHRWMGGNVLATHVFRLKEDYRRFPS